jgi:hypothetical protein
MASFLMNVGVTLASVIVPLAELADEKKGAYTSFAVGIGGITNGSKARTDGSIPHLTFWDDNGARISQYKGEGKGHWSAEQEYAKVVSNDQTVPKGQQAQPEYISVVVSEKDSLCITYVYATGNGAQYAWYGDSGFTCGADWYPSDWKVGPGVHTPKCVWIDANHTNKLRYKGFSLHLPDFGGEQGKVDEYNKTLDTLCKSDARMKFWENILPDDIIPFFHPPLVYNDDGSDVDPNKVTNKSKPHKRSSVGASRLSKRNGTSLLHPGHLVISHLESHSAKEVCESETSMGPDFVSTIEGVFCDMEQKEWWYLCSSEIADGFFDLGTQSMVSNGTIAYSTGAITATGAARATWATNATALNSRGHSHMPLKNLPMLGYCNR